MNDKLEYSMVSNLIYQLLFLYVQIIIK